MTAPSSLPTDSHHDISTITNPLPPDSPSRLTATTKQFGYRTLPYVPKGTEDGHGSDSAIDTESVPEEKGSRTDPVPQSATVDLVASFVQPSLLLSRARSRRGNDTLEGGKEEPERTCHSGPSCSQPAVLCTQASRASNCTSSPQFSTMALAQSRSISARGTVYIDWEDGDSGNPMNWSRRKKWTIIMCCFCFTGTTVLLATGFNAMGPQVELEFHVSPFVFLLGNTFYLVSVAVAPLVLAPFSELVGRKFIFIVSAFVTVLMLIPQALAPSIYGLHIPRIFQGIAASCGNSVTGGIVADCFSSHDLSLPMSTFALVVFIFQAIGVPTSAYTVKSYSWRINLWWQGAVALLSAVSMLICLDETCGPVLLSRRAAKMTKECGGSVVYRCRADDEKLSILQMIKTSVSRPLFYLTTEAIVISFSLWIAMLWGAIFMCVSAVPISFNSAYGWTPEQGALVLLSLAVGGFLGWLLNFIQESFYSKAWHLHHGQPPPETRLYMPAVGAIMAPVGLFWFAWSCRSGTYPVVPIVGLVLFAAGVFPIYMGVFVYLADCFRWYSSSAQAAQSFLRNTMAGMLSLAVPSMYHRLTPPVASSVLAAITAVLGLIPFVLLAYGAKIRAASPVAKALQREEEDVKEQRRISREKQLRKQERQAKKDDFFGERRDLNGLGDTLQSIGVDIDASGSPTPGNARKTTGEKLLEAALPQVRTAGSDSTRDIEKQ